MNHVENERYNSPYAGQDGSGPVPLLRPYDNAFFHELNAWQDFDRLMVKQGMLYGWSRDDFDLRCVMVQTKRRDPRDDATGSIACYQNTVSTSPRRVVFLTPQNEARA